MDDILAVAIVLLIFVGIPLLIFFVIIGSFVKNAKNKRRYKLQNQQTHVPNGSGGTYPQISSGSLNGAYRTRPLLTTSQYNFYTVLKESCDKEGLLVCPKAHLEDFIHVTAQDATQYRGYINSNYVDFLICDSHLKILVAVDVVDSSYNTQQGQTTNHLKNTVLDSVGIPFFRIKADDYYVTRINEILKNLTGATRETDKQNPISLEKVSQS